MGMQYSAYHFYGVHVPNQQWQVDHAWGEGERVSKVIRDLDLGDKSAKVGWLAAGGYDRDMLFLLIDIEGLDAEVKPGEFRLSPNRDTPLNWDLALRMVADAAGYTGLSSPGWITVPDVS